MANEFIAPFAPKLPQTKYLSREKMKTKILCSLRAL
jgi:hypothetical protein